MKEVRPEALKSPTMPIKDMRIIHDKEHPEYVPLSKSNLADMGISIDITEASVDKPDVSHIVDLTNDTEGSDCVYMDLTDETFNDEGNLTASFGDGDLQTTESKGLSESWPGAKFCRSENQNCYALDLTVLSPETRKLLNIKDPRKYIKAAETISADDSGKLGLLKIANRLNQAAARSVRRKSEERNLTPAKSNSNSSRSPSVESQIARPFSPSFRNVRSSSVERMPSEQPFSPPVRLLSKSRSPSMEKIGSPVLLGSLNVVSPSSEFRTIRASSVEKVASERPFSPPLRALARSRSSSLDKYMSPVTLPSLKTASFSSCDVSLITGDVISPNPKPLSASSPLENNTKSIANGISECKDNSVLTGTICQFSSGSDVSVTNCEQSSKLLMEVNNFVQQKELEEVSAEEKNYPDSNNVRENSTETIVIMTDSGEEISEAEAVLIAQAAVEQTTTESLSEESDANKYKGENQNLCNDNNNFENESESIIQCVNSDERKKFMDTDELIVEFEAERKPFGKESENDAIEIIEESSRSFSESPFIPRMREIEVSIDETFTTRNRKLLPLISDSKYTEKDTHANDDLHVNENEVDTSLKSGVSKMDTDESDSELVDITDSIVKASNTTHTLSLAPEVKNLSINSKMDTAGEFIDSDIEILENISCGNDTSRTENTEYKNKNFVSEIELTDTDNFRKKAVISINNNGSICLNTNIKNGQSNTMSNSDENEICCTPTASSDKAQHLKLAEGTCTEVLIEDTVENMSKLNDNIRVESICKLNKTHSTTVENTFKSSVDNSAIKVGIEIDQTKKEEHIEYEHFSFVQRNEQCNTEEIGSMKCTEDETDGDPKNSVIRCKEAIFAIPVSLSEYCESLHVNIVENLNCDIDNTCQPVVTITPEKEDSSSSQDKNIFERMKEFSLQPDVLEVKVDERSEAEKNEVLRGLGLERSEDVEKAKMSPKNTKSPLKTYPLRKNMMSPVRYRDTENLSSGSRCLLTGKKSKEHEGQEKLSTLPVLDPIAKKIKLESLAKSSPGEKGPFRCKTCKRSYRTEVSLKMHMEKCDFEVSTSDEDENENLSESPQSSRKEKMTGVGTNSRSTRSSLRKSTMVQRVALEMEEKRMKEEGAAAKRRVRLSYPKEKEPVVDNTCLKSQALSSHSYRKSIESNKFSVQNSKSLETEVVGGRRTRKGIKIKAEQLNNSNRHSRGRPRKNCLQRNVKGNFKEWNNRQKLSSSKMQRLHIANIRHLKKKIPDRHNKFEWKKNLVLDKKCSEDPTDNADLRVDNTKPDSNKVTTTEVKRGRGRPRKLLSGGSNDKLESKRTKLCDMNEKIHCISDEEATSDTREVRCSLRQENAFQQHNETSNPGFKATRGRPRKLSRENLDDVEESVLNSKEKSPSHSKEITSGVFETTKSVCKRGRGRPRKFAFDLPHFAHTEGSSSNISCEYLDTCSNPGHSLEMITSEKNELAPPKLKNMTGRQRKIIRNESAEPPVLELNPCRKRDLPSLKEEVEAFRRIKRLKRENSLEKAKLDVIEISDKSDDEDCKMSTNEKIDFINSSEVSQDEEVNLRHQEASHTSALVHKKESNDEPSKTSFRDNTKSKLQNSKHTEVQSEDLKIPAEVDKSVYHENNTVKTENERKDDEIKEKCDEIKHIRHIGDTDILQHDNISIAIENLFNTGETKTESNLRSNTHTSKQATENVDKTEIDNTIRNCEIYRKKRKNGHNEPERNCCQNQEIKCNSKKAESSINPSHVEYKKDENSMCENGSRVSINNSVENTAPKSGNKVKEDQDSEDNNDRHDNPVNLLKSIDRKSISEINGTEVEIEREQPNHKGNFSCKSGHSATETSNSNTNIYTSLRKKIVDDSKLNTVSNDQVLSEAGLSTSKSESDSLQNLFETTFSADLPRQESTDSLSVATNNSLSNTVLKLLKEGHKVLIKNPKLGKSFLWEKTERGYVGRPYEIGAITKATVSSSSICVDSGNFSRNAAVTHESSSACHSARIEPISMTGRTDDNVQQRDKHNPDFSTQQLVKMTPSEDCQTSVSSVSVSKTASLARTTAVQLLSKKLADKRALKLQSEGCPQVTNTEFSENVKLTEKNTKTQCEGVPVSCTEHFGTLKLTEKNLLISRSEPVLPVGNVNVAENNLVSRSVGNLKLSEMNAILSRSEVMPSLATISQLFNQKPGSLQESVKQTNFREIAASPLSTCKPSTGIEYLGGVVLSSSGSRVVFSSSGPIPVISQMPVQVSLSSKSPVPILPSLPNSNIYNATSFTSVHSQLPMESQVLSIIQTGMTRHPVSNLLPHTSNNQNYPPHQIAITPSLLPYSVNLYPPNQLSNTQQTSYLNQDATANFSLRPSVTSAARLVVHNSPGSLEPLQADIVSKTVSTTVTSAAHVATVKQNVELSAKNNNVVAKDVVDIVRNLQRHSNVSFLGSSNTLKPGFTFCDALRATANLSKENNNGRQESHHKFTSLSKPQQSSSYVDKIRQILNKKVLNPKTTSYLHRKHSVHAGKQSMAFKEIKTVQVPFKKNAVSIKPPVGIDKEFAQVHQMLKKKPYRKSVEKISPVKRKGRPRVHQQKAGTRRRTTALRGRKIEGPHSSGKYSCKPVKKMLSGFELDAFLR